MVDCKAPVFRFPAVEFFAVRKDRFAPPQVVAKIFADLRTASVLKGLFGDTCAYYARVVEDPASPVFLDSRCVAETKPAQRAYELRCEIVAQDIMFILSSPAPKTGDTVRAMRAVLPQSAMSVVYISAPVDTVKKAIDTGKNFANNMVLRNLCLVLGTLIARKEK